MALVRLNTSHLAGYLLYVGIPDIAAWWFDESRFGVTRGACHSATLSNLLPEPDEDDRAFFYGIAYDLEAVLAAEDDPVPLRCDFPHAGGLHSRAGSRRPQSGISALRPFPNAVVAGAALWERHEEVQDFTESEWLDLCARAGTDPAAGEVVIRVFEDAPNTV